jgi:zinc/manganese transport system substrate-binding protein
MRHGIRRLSVGAALAGLVAASTLLLAQAPVPAAAASGKVTVVAAENEYASVTQLVGGKYVSVTAIMSNPNTDPHTFEASTAVAAEVAGAQIVIQNGVGYDDFMQKIEAASPNQSRLVINAGIVAGFGTTAMNPHLWYDPNTMPLVAKAIVADLTKLAPAHAAYFQAHLKSFDASLKPWAAAIAKLRAAYKGTAVAVTEPVADYMLQAAGLAIKTPWPFQAAVMNGTDISPQDVEIEQNLVSQGKVKVFVYNQQAVDATTESLLTLAHKHNLPVVGVYETMPPGYTYPTWMTTEVNAIYKALKDHVSTAKLP